jgi:hypothetical protein
MEYVGTWPSFLLYFLTWFAVSKVTLDIICETAFGYNADSLHDPHNELAEAYEQLLALQSGMQITYPVSDRPWCIDLVSFPRSEPRENCCMDVHSRWTEVHYVRLGLQS